MVENKDRFRKEREADRTAEAWGSNAGGCVEMSKRTINEKIYEQYVEAATALVMEQYAVAMRENLCNEPQSEEAVEVPDALDQKCRKLIRRKLAKERRKHARKKLLRFTGYAAAAIIAVFGIGGILFATVDAVRVPIINLFIDQKDGYIEFRYAEDSDWVFENSEDPLAGLLPDGYALVLLDSSCYGSLFARYKNSCGDILTFNAYSDPSLLKVDNETAAKTEKVQILSYDGILIEKKGYQLVWLDTDEGKLYQLTASALSREEIIALAENIEKLS